MHLEYYKSIPLSVNIKLKNWKIKTSIVSPERTKARANKTVINFMIFILIIVQNCHDFSVWLRNGSNPPDINRFWSHTRKVILSLGTRLLEWTMIYYTCPDTVWYLLDNNIQVYKTRHYSYLQINYYIFVILL